MPSGRFCTDAEERHGEPERALPAASALYCRNHTKQSMLGHVGDDLVAAEARPANGVREDRRRVEALPIGTAVGLDVA